MQEERPKGVTIIIILLIIVGSFPFFLGINLVNFASQDGYLDAETIEKQTKELQQMSGLISEMSRIMPVQTLLAASGGIMIAFGVANFTVTYGLLERAMWAWIATFILTLIGIAYLASAVIAGNYGFVVLAGIPIYGVIIYYLFRPNVKA